MTIILEQFDSYTLPSERVTVTEGVVAIELRAKDSCPMVLLVRGKGEIIDPETLSCLPYQEGLTLYSETPKSVLEPRGPGAVPEGIVVLEDLAEANYHLRSYSSCAKVYWALSRFSRALGSLEVSLSFARLATHTGLSAKTVYRSVKKLQVSGVLTHSGIQFVLNPTPLENRD